MIKIFLARFPEFAESPEEGDRELISLTLEAAEAELNQGVWGSLFEEGVLFLAADKLMHSKFGDSQRDPNEPAAKSVYAIEFARLARIASMGARVI